MSDSFGALVSQVGEWSRRNFGEQDSLNEVAPLLGVVEELFSELPRAETRYDECDAYADACIFLADFASRCRCGESLLADMSIELFRDRELALGDRSIPYIEMQELLGDICKTVLKTRQGIRGHDRPLRDQSGFALQMIRFSQALARNYSDVADDCIPLKNMVWHTWHRVSKRDWASNPESAHSES